MIQDQEQDQDVHETLRLRETHINYFFRFATSARASDGFTAECSSSWLEYYQPTPWVNYTQCV